MVLNYSAALGATADAQIKINYQPQATGRMEEQITPLFHLCVAKCAWETISRKTIIIRTLLQADSPPSDKLDFNVLHAIVPRLERERATKE